MMRKHLEPRRYLVQFDTWSLPHIFADVLVIGSGVGGLRAAIEASLHGAVLLVTKDGVHESNTEHAQGGIAVAIAPGDNPQKHQQDTLAAGQGLGAPQVVKLVVENGPKRIEELIEWGARFDREQDELVFTREGGHREARIIHARGDATGAELERALVHAVRRNQKVKVAENTFCIDLVVDENTCRGALVWDAARGVSMVWAKETILAAGGCGQIYRETTNPRIATGDGVAIGYRAGATVEDLEFMQFHPTTLYVAGATRFLISEAVRGEGGILRNKNGERFMPSYHPDAELAPRDAVSRSIFTEMRKTDDTNVYLDVRHIPRDQLRTRFPKICELCASFDIDIAADLIPVRPSAHYMVGGIWVGTKGETNIEHLYGCGEVSCTGLHGANRLGSNSLLEGLVYGQLAGEAAGQSAALTAARPVPTSLEHKFPVSKKADLDLADIEHSLKSLMSRCVGVERDELHLGEANSLIDFWCSYVLDKEFVEPSGWQLQNMLTVTKLITVAALARQETRGVHHRKDFPDRDDANWRKRLQLRNGEPMAVRVVEDGGDPTG